MDQTIYLAKFMGLFLLVIGVLMLVRRKMVVSVFDGVYTNKSILYLIGVLEIVGGLLIILAHNIWSQELLSVLVTVLGWILLLEGILYVSTPIQRFKKLISALHRKEFYYLLSLAYILVGCVLTFGAILS